MKLSRASSYAINALAYMVSQPDPDPIPSHLIAQDRNIPERFLLKVLKPLVSARILTSIKGPNGGYTLNKNANEISLLEVIQAVDGPIRGDAPTDSAGVNEVVDGRLQKVCSQVADSTKKLLSEVTIAKLVRGR